MEKILTADEFQNSKYLIKTYGRMLCVDELMIEFAKLHVKIALDTIFEQSKHGDQEHQDWLKNKFSDYPLGNIK